MKRIFIIIKDILRQLTNIILPSRCLVCNDFISPGSLFCLKDFKKLKFISDPKCHICSQPFQFIVNNNKKATCADCLKNKPNFDSCSAIFVYNDTIAKAILDLKYQDATSSAQKFAQLIHNSIKHEINNYDIITPVPLHKKRLKERKFNQSSLICQEIAKKQKNLRFLPNLLLRSKYIQSQAGLSQSQREKNMRKSLIINDKFKKLIQGKKILLIDDVMASGATAENCSLTLKKAGCQEIKIAVIAKAILK